ncbi:MAG TPA: hypothetical protein VJB59_02180 [Bdellovibrionota bacterium]|nr:hypothetical protein [Bdellovibrionota bacterium]
MSTPEADLSKVTPNTPLWSARPVSAFAPFQESWYLRLNDLTAKRALWLKFSVLISRNGFRRVAETWAIYSQRPAGGEITKTALKQTYDMSEFSSSSPSTIQVNDCFLDFDPDKKQGRTAGSIRSKGNRLSWNLSIETNEDARFNLRPELFGGITRAKMVASTVAEDLRMTGTAEFNGEKIAFKKCPGMQGHVSGPHSNHSWVWGHCNSFRTEQGAPAPFIFEGLSIRKKCFASLPVPQLSSFYFFYNNKAYAFSSLWSSLRSKSRNTLTDWEFQADSGDLSFRGHAHAEHKDFAGLTFEDTRGALLYCANSNMSDLKIHVYRRGKVEAAFQSDGTAAFEVISRTKNPYVPLLI